MKALINELKSRKEELQCAIKVARRILGRAPAGKLVISSCRGNWQYLAVEGGQRTYLGKKQAKQRELLANKDYAEKFLKSAEEEIKWIEHYLTVHTENGPEQVYDKLHEARKKLVSPIILPDDIYAQIWQEKRVVTNPYHVEELIYETKHGEYVRSKSEVMLANLYDEMGIPYHYEAQLLMKNGMPKYPDFTLLRLYDRKEIYHEHLGLLDDEIYRQSNLNKIKVYSDNGIILGENLIITYETSACPLDIRQVRTMLEKIMHK